MIEQSLRNGHLYDRITHSDQQWNAIEAKYERRRVEKGVLSIFISILIAGVIYYIQDIGTVTYYATIFVCLIVLLFGLFKVHKPNPNPEPKEQATLLFRIDDDKNDFKVNFKRRLQRQVWFVNTYNHIELRDDTRASPINVRQIDFLKCQTITPSGPQKYIDTYIMVFVLNTRNTNGYYIEALPIQFFDVKVENDIRFPSTIEFDMGSIAFDVVLPKEFNSEGLLDGLMLLRKHFVPIRPKGTMTVYNHIPS